MCQRRAPLLLVLRDPVYDGIATQVAQLAESQKSNGWLKPTRTHNFDGLSICRPYWNAGGNCVAFLERDRHCTAGPPC
jgi:hypothetical protein